MNRGKREELKGEKIFNSDWPFLDINGKNFLCLSDDSLFMVECRSSSSSLTLFVKSYGSVLLCTRNRDGNFGALLWLTGYI